LILVSRYICAKLPERFLRDEVPFLDSAGSTVLKAAGEVVAM